MHKTVRTHLNCHQTQVTSKHVNYIGVDLSNDAVIVTNQNPHFKGLVDIHKCIYLPSGHDNVSVSGEASSTAKVINIILVLLGYVVKFIYVYMYMYI